MQKKSRSIRVALFIGLLSFHTFSSCVHTRQALGMDRESIPYHLVSDAQGQHRTTNWRIGRLVNVCCILLMFFPIPIFICVMYNHKPPLGSHITELNNSNSFITALGPDLQNLTIPSISNFSNSSGMPTGKLNKYHPKN